MADPTNGEAEEELVDYEEDEVPEADKAGAKAGEQVKKGYVGIHSSGFKDFLLKPELLRAIVDCGFEHPSEGAQAPLRGACSVAPPVCGTDQACFEGGQKVRGSKGCERNDWRSQKRGGMG